MIEIEIPGQGVLRIANVLVDMNGTLAVDGRVEPQVCERLEHLARSVHVVVATADTFGRANAVFNDLPGVELKVLTAQFGSAQKEKILDQLGPGTTVAIGNGINDHRMLARAVLGIAVIGREGAAWDTLRRARIVVADPCDALDLLLIPDRLVATLRD